MEKLSEEGKLYLKDYLILEEARNDANRFLNTIIERVYSLVENEKDDLNTDNFRLVLWENKTTRGQMSVRFGAIKDINLFRKDLFDVFLRYRDIRNTTDLSSARKIKLYLYSPAVSSKLENKLQELSEREYGENIYDPQIIKINLDSSQQSAEKIAEIILNKCMQIINLLIILAKTEQ